MAIAFVTVATLLGPNLLKGLASLLIGVTIGLVGIESQSGQARLTFGLPTLLDGIDVVIVVVALFALGEVFAHALAGGGGGTVEPLRGRAVMSREDWRRSWPAWLRGTALRVPDREPPRRRGGDPDVPQLCHREAAVQAPGGVRARGDRGRRRARGRQQRRRGGRPRPAADDRTADVCHRRGDPHRVPVVRAAARPRAVHRVRAAGLRPAGQPLHRQRDAAGAQPAAGTHLGAAAHHPGAHHLRRHPGVRHPRDVRVRRVVRRPDAALRAGPARPC